MTDDDFTIPISVFENKDDNQPSRHDMEWHALARRLFRYDERLTKDGRAWSPVTYLPGTTRGKSNVDQVYALTLDIDHSTDGLPLDLLEEREYVAHTTHSHTPEAPRWRVVLPLLRPVSGADWPAFWLRANAYFGGCVDPATKDSSRIFYLPSCPPGAMHETRQQHGLLLDPDELPAVPVYEPPVVERRNGQRGSVLNHGLTDWARRFAEARVSELSSMPSDSGRNTACNRLAYLLGGLIADPLHELTVESVTDQLLDACHRNGLVADDGQRSVETTIRSGLESGLTHAWSPADQSPPPVRLHSNGHVQQQEAPPAGTRLEVVRMSEVVSEAVDWLWRNRLARGKATLLMGDPGLGKSLISHWLAAQVSVGAQWPDGSGQCDLGAAILFTIEDGLADTVGPRLEAANADRTRVFAVRGVIDPESSIEERMFTLETHVSLLEEEINRYDVRLIALDPVTAYLGANINAHKDSDVRRVLAPLQFMAERTGVACLLLMHLTKGSGVSALYRATGSIAFPAVCRIVLGVAPDPNDADGRRRLLLPIKMNIAPEAQGIGYHIETVKRRILPRADERDQPPILVWDDEPVLVDATSAMDRTGTVQEVGALAECKRALVQILSDGRLLARDGERQLKEAGASTSPVILVRARRELGIITQKDGMHGPWYWVPPTNFLFTHARTHARSPGEDSSQPSKDSEAVEGFSEGFSKNHEDSEGSSRTHAREAPEMRYCPACKRNLTSETYDQHLCPKHGECFDAHECDAL